MSKVVFLGTGLVGRAMVERMLRHGDAVTVWNRTESKARALEPLGAKVAANPADAVAGAARVHMSLPDDEVVDEIVRKISSSLEPNTVVVDHSTTSPAGTKARLGHAAASGIRFIHAPVFMSPQMCRDGVGMMLVSGPTAVYNEVQPALARMTGQVWYLGERSDLAASYKPVGNSLLFAIIAGLADSLALAKSVNLPPKDAVALFSNFDFGHVIPARAAKIASGDFSATFEMTMARKDLRLMLEAANGESLSMLRALAPRMDEAIAHGHGQDDLSAIAAV
jgi:3-hydroxyisobutyrate dehydrogenase-like beta-hydroxyacid dehydrogenase